MAYEPDFSLPNLNTASVRDRCRDLFAKYSGIKHVWDPNGWPFANREYITTIEILERSDELIDLNATVASFPAKVVFLRRRDQFSRIVSDLMGQQLGLWGHSPGEPHTPNERVQYRQIAKQSEIAPINSQIVEWYMMNAWNQEEALIERTPKDQRLIAYYEDLFDHKSWMKEDFSAWVQLASWVGAEPRLCEEYVRNLIAPQDKYNTEEILKKIPNYNELTAKFSGPNQRHGKSHMGQDGSCVPASEACSPQGDKRGISDSAENEISPSGLVTGSAIFAETVEEELEGGDPSKSCQIPNELRRELREWELTGRKARFWWRDDDAVSDTPALRRLLALAEEIGTVVGLAVIPEHADDGLVKLVESAPACIWQHGWRHQWQHKEGDLGYSQGEFGEGRDLESMMADAHNGQVALERKFGNAGWQRVFVPPFHALSIPFKMMLPSLGYRGLSAGLPRTLPIDTVTEVNADVDIMDWLERKAHGLDVISKMLVEQLVSRRQGQIPAGSPIGLLTHHLAHDEGAWRSVTELLRFLKTEPAVELVPAQLLFGRPNAKPLGSSCFASSDSSETIDFDEITVVVTSCGRQDLLETTLDSFLQHNTFPIKEFIIVEDGNGAKNRALMEKYRRYPFKWLATGQRVGQVAAIDIAYQQVRTELIFHCEDDWEFFSPGFIEKSLAVLDQNHSILQVWIRGLNDTNECPVLDYTLTAAGVPYRLVRHHYGNKWGTWHGFSWNPGLRRRRDYRLLGNFGFLDPERTRKSWQVESDAGGFYQQRGFCAAILADNEGRGYVRHTGFARQIPHDYLAPPFSAPGSAGTAVSSESAASWSLGWDDWVSLGEILRMPVTRVGDSVYAMQCLPDSGIASLSCTLSHQPSTPDAPWVAREVELGEQIRQLSSSLDSARAQAVEQEAHAGTLRIELDAVYASLSWRVMKPLRSIGARYPGLCRWIWRAWSRRR
jgi:hypothetical protein